MDRETASRLKVGDQVVFNPEGREQYFTTGFTPGKVYTVHEVDRSGRPYIRLDNGHIKQNNGTAEVYLYRNNSLYNWAAQFDLFTDGCMREKMVRFITEKYNTALTEPGALPVLAMLQDLAKEFDIKITVKERVVQEVIVE